MERTLEYVHYQFEELRVIIPAQRQLAQQLGVPCAMDDREYYQQLARTDIHLVCQRVEGAGLYAAYLGLQ